MVAPLDEDARAEGRLFCSQVELPEPTGLHYERYGERQRRARDQRVALDGCRYYEVEVAREQGFQRQLGVGARRSLIYTVLVTHPAAMATPGLFFGIARC